MDRGSGEIPYLLSGSPVPVRQDFVQGLSTRRARSPFTQWTVPVVITVGSWSLTGVRFDSSQTLGPCVSESHTP